MSSFKSAYPGVRRFIDKTVEDCRKTGFVVTIGGRRRFDLVPDDDQCLVLTDLEKKVRAVGLHSAL